MRLVATADDSTGGFRYKAADDEDAASVVFACVCLGASNTYAIEAAYWCAKAE